MLGGTWKENGNYYSRPYFRATLVIDSVLSQALFWWRFVYESCGLSAVRGKGSGVSGPMQKQSGILKVPYVKTLSFSWGFGCPGVSFGCKWR